MAASANKKYSWKKGIILLLLLISAILAYDIYKHDDFKGKYIYIIYIHIYIYIQKKKYSVCLKYYLSILIFIFII